MYKQKGAAEKFTDNIYYFESRYYYPRPDVAADIFNSLPPGNLAKATKENFDVAVIYPEFVIPSFLTPQPALFGKFSFEPFSTKELKNNLATSWRARLILRESDRYLEYERMGAKHWKGFKIGGLYKVF